MNFVFSSSSSSSLRERERRNSWSLGFDFRLAYRRQNIYISIKSSRRNVEGVLFSTTRLWCSGNTSASQIIIYTFFLRLLPGWLGEIFFLGDIVFLFFSKNVYIYVYISSKRKTWTTEKAGAFRRRRRLEGEAIEGVEGEGEVEVEAADAPPTEAEEEINGNRHRNHRRRRMEGRNWNRLKTKCETCGGSSLKLKTCRRNCERKRNESWKI